MTAVPPMMDSIQSVIVVACSKRRCAREPLRLLIGRLIDIASFSLNRLTRYRSCHYGPENSGCVTFDTPFLIAAAHNTIEPVYTEVTGLNLDCDQVETDNVVCPKGFGKGQNPGC